MTVWQINVCDNAHVCRVHDTTCLGNMKRSVRCKTKGKGATCKPGENTASQGEEEQQFWNHCWEGKIFPLPFKILSRGLRFKSMRGRLTKAKNKIKIKIKKINYVHTETNTDIKTQRNDKSWQRDNKSEWNWQDKHLCSGASINKELNTDLGLGLKLVKSNKGYTAFSVLKPLSLPECSFMGLFKGTFHSE